MTNITTQKPGPPPAPSAMDRARITRLLPRIAQLDPRRSCGDALILLQRMRRGETQSALLESARVALIEFGKAGYATEALACLIRIRFWDERDSDFARTRRTAARKLSELIRNHATELDDALRVEAQHDLYAHYVGQQHWHRALACAAREILRTRAYAWHVLSAQALKELGQHDRAFKTIRDLTEDFGPQSIERHGQPTNRERRDAWILKSRLLDEQHRYGEAVEAFKVAEHLNGIGSMPPEWRPTEWYLIRRSTQPKSP